MLSSARIKLTKLRVVALSFALAAGLGLAACGGGDSSSTSSEASSTSSDTSSTSANASDIRAQFDDLLKQQLESQPGIPTDVATCVEDKIQQDVSDQEIQDLVNSGQLTPALTQKLQQDAIACAQQSGG
jgi:ABC-type glycerol-3-phosphate transport system substrate-binding protein